jgi:hypothetical protein
MYNRAMKTLSVNEKDYELILTAPAPLLSTDELPPPPFAPAPSLAPTDTSISAYALADLSVPFSVPPGYTCILNPASDSTPAYSLLVLVRASAPAYHDPDAMDVSTGSQQQQQQEEQEEQLKKH